MQCRICRNTLPKAGCSTYSHCHEHENQHFFSIDDVGGWCCRTYAKSSCLFRPEQSPVLKPESRRFRKQDSRNVGPRSRCQSRVAWWARRKSFVDKTLRAGICDVIVGLPSSFPGVLTTQPYYRSSYVFVYRKDTGVQLRSLNDAALSRLRIGIHVVDADLAPPAQLLARRGIVQHVKGYSLFGSYGEPNPPAKIIEAVRKREIDVAIVWGPLGGGTSDATW